MDSNALLVLSAYSAAIFAASFLGGKLAALGTMTHTRTQVVMSLVAGFILGIAMFHLLPHSLNRIPGPDMVEKAVGWMVLGMVLMIFLLRIFHFHRHDFSSEASDLYDQHDHGSSGIHSRSLFGVAIGLGVHTVTEGIALGTSMKMGPPHENDVALGRPRGIPRHSAAQAARCVLHYRHDEVRRSQPARPNIGQCRICHAVPCGRLG